MSLLKPSENQHGCGQHQAATPGTQQFYNVDLLDITRKGDGEDSVAVVDDTTILARGANLEDTFRKLEDIMTRLKGALEWSDLHDCEFAPKQIWPNGIHTKVNSKHSRTKQDSFSQTPKSETARLHH
jgi:hypothetical protein